MTDTYAPRLFARAEDIRATGEAMLARTLPKEAWTHEAHLATCLWLLVERPDIRVDRDIGDLIRRYNEAVGGVNDATQGYHESITRAFVAGVRFYLVRTGETELLAAVNGLLGAPEGQRDWPLRFYSRDKLFSAEARLGFVEPDLGALPRI
ncbi:hypothetical protein [Sphingobium nicotianae]|uniref:Uncharacterized protein n=1 Tax=Sphingobium nicotianae TaxID=2782607 RepID=A0A9X1ITH9_9SPHN|nr:hypothetical protein [Sphingobium nicotianae]MBT2189327.1 hypothetical protein [Sphingobium nicotianae]